MLKSRKKRGNRYQESKFRRLKDSLCKFRVIFGFFAGFCLLLVLGAGLSRLYFALLDVPWLKVEEIEIAGLKKLDRTEILNTMGVPKGECILNLRMRPIAERLKALPAIKSASVRLDSTRRIVAEIVEREPVAIVKCGDSFLMMDDEGILFAQADPDGNRTAPLITGVCGANAAVGGAVPSRSLHEVRALLAAMKKAGSWLPAASVQECRWKAGGFTLILGERAVPVDIGKDNFERKLAKLRKVIHTLNERQWTELVNRIDLDYPGKAYLDGQFPVPKTAPAHGKQPG